MGDSGGEGEWGWRLRGGQTRSSGGTLSLPAHLATKVGGGGALMCVCCGGGLFTLDPLRETMERQRDEPTPPSDAVTNDSGATGGGGGRYTHTHVRREGMEGKRRGLLLAFIYFLPTRQPRDGITATAAASAAAW